MKNLKKIISPLLLLLAMCNTFAQEQTSCEDNHIIYIDIPKSLNIKDKIILSNKSPYTILQSVAVWSYGEHQQKILGSTTYVAPNSQVTMASYDDNWLKRLRGNRIALKVKGLKKEGDWTAVSGSGNLFNDGRFGSTIGTTNIPAEVLNNIDPALITYDFIVTIREVDHDLYITLLHTGNASNDVFDF